MKDEAGRLEFQGSVVPAAMELHLGLLDGRGFSLCVVCNRVFTQAGRRQTF